MTPPRVVLMATWLATACAPRVLWSGFDPARTTTVEVVMRDKQQWVRGGDAPPTRFDAVGKGAVLISNEGGRVAFAAKRGTGWFVVAGERTFGPWDGIAELTASRDGAHVGFAAQTKNHWQAVIDGVLGPAYTRIEASSIHFSEDGRHAAYVATEGACAFLVVDGASSACLRRVLSAKLSDSGVAAALVREDGHDRLVFQPASGEPQVEDAIGEWALSSDGAHVAYAAKRDGHWVAVVDGIETRACEHMGRPRFGDDGRRLAFICGDAVVVDDEKGAAFDEVRALTLAPHGPTFAYVARDESGEWVVSEDGMSGPFAHVDQLLVPPAGGPASFIARADGLSRVVHGDRGLTFPLVIPGSLAITDDGSHWAAITGDFAQQRLWLVVDGVRARNLTVAEVMQDAPIGPWLARELRDVLVARSATSQRGDR